MPRLEDRIPVKGWNFAETIVALPIASPPEKSLMGQLVRHLASRSPEKRDP